MSSDLLKFLTLPLKCQCNIFNFSLLNEKIDRPINIKIIGCFHLCQNVILKKRVLSEAKFLIFSSNF